MENKKEEKKEKVNIFKKPWMQSLISFVVIFGALAGFIFWQINKDTVFIENSELEAPIINISPTSSGTLNSLYVKEGDNILPNSKVALVGSQILYSEVGGIVSFAPNVLGSYFSPGQTVVSMVNVEEMKVVGEVDENKGLSNLKVGQHATFTVDTFAGKTYEGIVDEISPVAKSTSVVFSISDQRPVNKFDVEVRFNITDYPELKSGMSAKITVYTNGR